MAASHHQAGWLAKKLARSAAPHDPGGISPTWRIRAHVPGDPLRAKQSVIMAVKLQAWKA